ncbi:hypothetical protein O3P69_002998 [Scylla paramamosain]|uniref:Secreted protein n=1 Tax=Scylla paramamosain TaxID=85552 RepID=A0AAW0UIU8_SCYPA
MKLRLFVPLLVEELECVISVHHWPVLTVSLLSGLRTREDCLQIVLKEPDHPVLSILKERGSLSTTCKERSHPVASHSLVSKGVNTMRAVTFW